MNKLFLFFLFSILTSAQNNNFTVKFKFYKNKSYDNASETKSFTLNQNDDNSIFELDNFKDTNNFKHKEIINLMTQRDTMSIYTVNNEGFLFLYQEKNYKDFKKNVQVYNELIEYKCQYIQDKIDMFDWQLLNEKDTLIANYICKKATTRFRGRDYIAYYTSEIANQGGPWKFDGLPGFILKINSKDGYLSIEPLEVKLYQNKILKNPFGNKKTILFGELINKILELEKKSVARIKSKPNAPDKITMGPSETIEDLGLKERVYE